MHTQAAPDPFVDWFRSSSPYIHAHRRRTFVISFDGEALLDPNFTHHVHDFALLNSLGVRLVLVHGIRPQIEQRLKKMGIKSAYKDGFRITDQTALECVKEAAGSVRVELEAMLSMGLPDSPMAGAAIRVASGNFVTARPLGVRDGVDFCHTGEVRRISAAAIREQLERGGMVLISPIGYSATGEVFNLSAEDVAMSVASALQADKLLLLIGQDCVANDSKQLIKQITSDQAEGLLSTQGTIAEDIEPHLKAAVSACQAGVGRAHLINWKTDGVLLRELFTRDGIGTLVSKAPFEKLRPASIDDISGILKLIEPLEASGLLVRRSRENLEIEIENFWVIERDSMVIGCAALHAFPNQGIGELACLAMHSDYRGECRGKRLLEQIEAKAELLEITRLFVLTTQTTHWFREHGFEPAQFDQLPVERQALYNYKRNSKILVKALKS